MSQVLMPKATAVWLVENTTLTFDQISAFTGLHPLEIQAIADGEVAGGMTGLDPTTNGQLTKEEIRQIADKMVGTVSGRLSDMGITLDVSDAALDKLADAGFDPVYGARPLRRTIQSMIEDAAAEKLLDGSLKAGEHVNAVVEDDKIVLNAA